ncbi:PqqD family protein [Peribacillus muralis]|uniref:PqqD family protein n=1 Tax=Peribacillus muralis TaxID=264697 RepID=UPI001F4E3C42|nr:PqqD family protein [Peribacillus muralis]MCK1993424.1 PqqD family protein [Peribacillus muralis]MCK2014288.1 PqqD family protein [Peribacillus muralis]
MVQYIQCSTVEATQLDEEWIILHTENFTVTKLNEIGGFCWGLLNQAQTVDSLVQSLSNQYVAMEEISTRDIESYLLDLLQFGLIKHVI